MRSVIQESSTLTKAIKKGWEKAGKPKDFSVKIYEEAEKNFFGFTKKSAKVGIFVRDRTQTRRRRSRRQEGQRRRQPAQRRYKAQTNERGGQQKIFDSSDHQERQARSTGRRYKSQRPRGPRGPVGRRRYKKNPQK